MADVVEQVLMQLADLQACSPAEVTAAYSAGGDLPIDSKQAEWIAAQLEEQWGTELLGEAALDPLRLTSVRSLSELFCQALQAPDQARPPVTSGASA